MTTLVLLFGGPCALRSLTTKSTEIETACICGKFSDTFVTVGDCFEFSNQISDWCDSVATFYKIAMDNWSIWTVANFLNIITDVLSLVTVAKWLNYTTCNPSLIHFPQFNFLTFLSSLLRPSATTSSHRCLLPLAVAPISSSLLLSPSSLLSLLSLLSSLCELAATAAVSLKLLEQRKVRPLLLLLLFC